MLSIVPLMDGGGLFETGAGGSAPKHVQQFDRENHLRWDSLGEFLALAVSLELLADKDGQPARARCSATRSTARPARVLEQDRSPVAQDRRARQPRQPLLPRAVLGAGARRSRPTTRSWPSASRRWPSGSPTTRSRSSHELAEVQGSPVDIGGYYRPDPERVAAAMRPSKTLNEALEGI